jgi:predicted Zn finger-like uncharacterized protein
MKITCQSCQSKYTVSDEKVQGKTVKIKCRKCGATIIVNSSGATSQANGGVADPVSTSGGADGSYLVNVADGDQRTMSAADLVAAYQSGVVNAETYVWADGMADWQPIAQVDALVAALNEPPQASAYPDPGSAYPETPAYEAAPVASAYEAAPAASPAPLPVAAAPFMPEPAAPRAAVRRDPLRRSQDLFGGGMAQTAHEDVATSAPLFSAPSAGGNIGQRDENSTLFSLSALTAKAAVAPSAPRTTATREDSGLIDLRALAEAGPAPAPAANMMPDNMGLFPLGAPPIAAAPALAAPGSIPAPSAKRSPIFIIIGSVVALAAIIGVFFVVKGGGEKPVPTADTAAQAAPPPPSATTEAAPSATASAAAAATAEASAEPSATAAVKAAGGKGGRGRPGGGKPKGASAPEAPAAPAKPSKGSCGCAAGDLMCAMKCSAK